MLHDRLLPSGVKFAGAAVMPVNGMPTFGLEPHVEPEPEVETVTEQAMGLSESYAGVLMNPIVSSKPESEKLKRECAELISQLAGISERAGKYLAAVEAERQSKLEKSLEEMRAEGRRQVQATSEAEQEFWRAEQALADAENKRRECNLRLRDHRERLPGRFATKGERGAHDRKERELIKLCQKADSDFAEALAARNLAAQRSNQETVKLSEISAQADRLEAAREGRAINDPETGLQGVPLG